ncbi:MAG: hypothetical protein ACRELD_08525 [Longimicrobiales bacterium]
MLRCATPLVALLVTTACDSDPTDPGIPRADLQGVYDFTILSFDPQGSLPEVDIRARLGAEFEPTLNLISTGSAQLVYQDAQTGAVETVPGTFTTGSTTVTITFTEGTPFHRVLLSRSMTFQWNATARTLTFADTAPDGVDLTRLRELVPEWEDEPLSDPVPGELTIVFTHR